MSEGPLFLGVDGGGTRTRCLAADGNGRVLGEGEAGPSNCLAVGTGAAAAAVMAAVEHALDQAGRSMADVSAVCAGLAGAGRPEDQAEVAEALSLYFPPAVRIMVLSDARIALAGALDGRPGAIVIAGTGSIAYGINGAGETYRAGGWGWVLGDEGSGYAIGRGAVRAALAAQDGSGPATVLGQRVCAAWGLESPDQAIRRVYADVAAARGEMAALAPLVAAAADEGDAAALEILEQAGRDLARLAGALLRRLALPAAPTVAMVGGVLTGCLPLREAFTAALTAQVADVQVIEPLGSPARGAVLLARGL